MTPVHQQTVRTAASAAVRTVLYVLAAGIAVLAIGPVTGLYRTLPVLSGSMRPFAQPGDVVVVTPVAARDLRVGDIITYHLPSAGRLLVTHRIVAISQPGDHPLLQTQGDANTVPDPKATLQESRVWRTRAVVPRLGFPLVALRQPWMRLLGSVLVPLLLLGSWLQSIWSRDDSEEHPEQDTDESADEAASTIRAIA
ncbi:MAG: signal peptidase [Gaiellaceae bacterium]|nr:signal peptidase [Gaiellaceae bacterium]